MKRLGGKLACLLALVACMASAHEFHGVWITDAEMARRAPNPVKARQSQSSKLAKPDPKEGNRHILFRRAFELDDVRTARVFITADDYYKLYVNGDFVGQGPAAGFPEHTYYNEFDVTHFLKAGRNVIAVHTYYQGLINRVWVSGDNRHGLLMDLEVDGKIVVSSDASFRVARHRAYSACGTAGYQTQFLECYDASAPEVGFERADFDDAAWASAVVHPRGGDYRVFAQPTPSVETEWISPTARSKDASGVWHFDFGGIYVGAAVFAAQGPKGAQVRILCGQERDADGQARHKLRCNCDYDEAFVLSGGVRDVLNPFDYKSFRYLDLVVPTNVTLDVGSVRLRARHAPFKLRAKPNFGDDPDLARIWRLCVDTFRYGVQEQVQDCMEREKGYYLGDGCYTAHALCRLTGDWTPARRLFDDFLRTKDIDRGLVTCANCAFMQEIAEYSLMLIPFAKTYLDETGDVDFIRDRYEALADVMNCYRERYARSDGLLCNLDKWCVVEWPDNFRDGYDADVRDHRVCTDVHNVINAWYVGAVKTMNELAHRLGKPPYADAQALEAAFVKVFWDPTRHLFVDREGSSHVSMPGNVYANYLGLAPADDRDAAHAAFLELVRDRRYAAISLFQFYPLFAYLKRTGEQALLHELLVSPDAWLRMLREGATRTFEGWGRETKWNTSLFHLTCAAAAVFLCDPATSAKVRGGYPIRGAALGHVRTTHGFWHDRLETNRTATLNSVWAKCHETPRIANFTNAANRAWGTFGGIPFDDSDVFKVMEGTAYILAEHPDAKRMADMNWLIGQIARAQEEDGYLYTARTLGFGLAVESRGKSVPWRVRMMGPTRWSNTASSHELYNNGHMIEAAVAWYETTGNDNFLNVARKAADLIDRTFGPAETQLRYIPGHEEIELALVKLYQATGERRYLELARFFLGTRGKGTQLINGVPCGEDGTPQSESQPWRRNVQDHLPVVLQHEAVGHAVRAGYLYCGMADVAACTGDSAYADAIAAIWQNVVAKKLHIHGGIGARPKGEAFGADYELPNDVGSTYDETCAQIANVLWNYRMFRASGDARYVDVMERTLYNGFVSGVSLKGDTYFYPNPLASKGNYKRKTWFGCSCCPVNDVRFFPQIPTMAYATNGKDIYWNLFMASEAEVNGVKMKVETEYPWKGDATLTVCSKPSSFVLYVRIPGWAVGKPVPSDLYTQVEPSRFADVSVSVNGRAVDACPNEKGYVTIDRAWKIGDSVRVVLPMPIQRIRAHEKVEADRGRLAVEKGPLVYCAEGVDNGGKAYAATLPANATFEDGTIEIGDKTFPSLRASNGLVLIPYGLWGNRQPGNDLQTWFKE